MLSALYHLGDHAALLARRLVLEGNLIITEKRDALDLLTNVDLANQAFIVGNLLQTWPKLHVIGEEQNVTQKFDQINVDCQTLKKEIPKALMCPMDDIIVYVDPIDGTKEFTEGFYSQVLILIGIALKGRPIAGIMCQPWKEDSKDSERGVFLWGLVGHGISPIDPSQFGSKLLALPDLPPFPQSLTATVTQSKGTPELEAYIKKHNFQNVLRVGGCGYKFLLLILGKADVFALVSPGTYKWDICGPEAILRTVGGTLTNLSGIEYHYGKDSLGNLKEYLV
uniref:3'(2'),5'-bisphosphate nucleotidase 1 n=1 Tax=Arcella intermedia TaxID=1963864 RepID=A0A6B2LD23_9EUKA